MKYPFYSGLSGKIAMIFLAGFILVALPINLFVYSKLETTIINSDNLQLNAEATKLSSQVKLDPVVVPLASVGYSMHIQVFNGQFFQSVFSSPDFPQLSDEMYFLETIEIDTLKVFNKHVPITGSTDELMVSIARSNRSVHDQLAEFRIYLFYITGSAFIILVVLVFSLSEIMLKPLKRIVTAADRVQAAETMERLPIPAVDDETRELSLTLNNMLTRIENSLNTQMQFFDSATHELKTPLTIMKAQLSLALTSTTDTVSRKTLESILEECERLERTISDFLLLSQLKNSKLSLQIETYDVGEVVFSVLSKIKNMADQKRISFQFNQTKASFYSRIDRDKIQTVVFNMLENAVTYSPEGSCIKLSLSNQESEIFLTVRNPLSMSIESFEKLGSERHTNPSAARGMGLGLWICNQIIGMHKGKLTLNQADSEFIATIKLEEEKA
ncbi:MAG TPA: histidine kinase dimerization/phospho-acceptor domain-containing protein [Cyclobacteriaceae bacterium]|nr:histidine kinase dimerization/phospho-acceptor domain-containing protein [Cyclobacteriaceae bacterium]